MSSVGARVMGRRLVDLVGSLKHFGRGERVMKTKWTGLSSFYTITEAKQNPNDAKQVAFYGIKTWGGRTEERPRRIYSTVNRDWTFFVPHSKTASAATQSKTKGPTPAVKPTHQQKK